MDTKLTAGASIMPPSASTLLEALRGMGYSPGAAVADIVDNSIAAGAKHIYIDFHWSEEDVWVTFRDDGCGMSADKLCLAMKLGSIPVNAERTARDLGRFGMGLKTASFSQCRRLTVASVQGGVFNCRRWDLDVLAQSDDSWLLLYGPAPGSEDRLKPLHEQQTDGTLVLWELLDRFCPSNDQKVLLETIQEIEDHLSLTFCYYINEFHLKIFINGKKVNGRDPFMATAHGTRILPAAYKGSTAIQGFLLPQKSLIKERDYKIQGGSGGWTAAQGFYLFRNRRLILAGTWLGLSGLDRSPLYNRVRIRVDIPASEDSEWKIDIRKSSARPPAAIRAFLKKLAEDMRELARQHVKGSSSPRSSLDEYDAFQLWTEQEGLLGPRYTINMSHPWVKALMQEAGSPLAGKFHKFFKVLEQMLPQPSDKPDAVQKADLTTELCEPPDAVKKAIYFLGQSYLDLGLPLSQVKSIMCNTQNFSVWQDYINSCKDFTDA